MTGQQLVSSINILRSRLDDCTKLQSVLFNDNALRDKLNESSGLDTGLVLSGIELSLSEYKKLLERALEETIVPGVTFK